MGEESTGDIPVPGELPRGECLSALQEEACAPTQASHSATTKPRYVTECVASSLLEWGGSV